MIIIFLIEKNEEKKLELEPEPDPLFYKADPEPTI